ncbi:MAG: Flp pilus assembly complex ATPase component TadA [Treponema sp.]|nr:Flp pilus assembly complex ATPase component TadA [Treponema sp.]
MNKKLSAQFCENNNIAVISEKEDFVIIGYTKEPDAELKGRLERYFLPQKSISFKRLENEEYDILITRAYSGVNENSSSDKEIEKESAISAAKSAPSVNLLNSIITEGIHKSVSDIHIDVEGEKTHVKYRKDGKLYPMIDTDCEKGAAVVARIKLLSDLNILDHRKCQDGRFDFERKNNIYDIRVSIIPGISGESAVLRILGGAIRAPEIETLGFNKSQLEQIQDMMNLKHGLVLVTGPTGSGKTTTLAAIISRLSRKMIQIITIEDPVEYRIKNVLQVCVDEGIGKTFAEVLKRVLRHDPDILMVGEIRDEQTALMACRLALTGHLVFASLHTGCCEETPLRLIDMGVPAYIVCSVLKGIISQVLTEKDGEGRFLEADIQSFKNKGEVRKLCE